MVTCLREIRSLAHRLEGSHRVSEPQEIDEDVAYFGDCYGIGKLVAALRDAGLHFTGETTQRMVDADIDVRDTEAMMIIYVLRPALVLGRERDPFVEHLFPDVADTIEVPDLDDTEDDPVRTDLPD